MLQWRACVVLWSCLLVSAAIADQPSSKSRSEVAATFTFEATAYNNTETHYKGTFPLPAEPNLRSFLVAQNSSAGGGAIRIEIIQVSGDAYLIDSMAGCSLELVEYCFYNDIYVNGEHFQSTLPYDKIPVKAGDNIRMDYATPMKTDSCGSACSSRPSYGAFPEQILV
eukprot:gnl/TRDRNA2_/TRDRNA2_91414_c1_seq1.p1 gnl/TRDRNA2_/TRDRNA2_91414_c1~~gnl/TRDRNA2_/TRDRNA2_91414_c1_seq1.p1  ORF type:complete len:168 (-),score=18.58 gnl/TRDRNA2_/TRDRNA2_91414_c1_seq1:68-571(-)